MMIVLTWLRLEMRRRRRSLLVLALLVALASGTVLAAVAGARRGASAVDRLLERTEPATAVASPQDFRFDWTPVRTLPGVEAVSTFPGYSGFGVDEAPGRTVALYLPADDDAMRTVERPVVLEGRLADPTRVDEAVVTREFVTTSGHGVGDTVTLRLFTPDQVDNGVSGVPVAIQPHPDGPTQPVRIVGVVRSLFYGDSLGERGRLFPSPALIQRYRAQILGASGDGALNALVRLRDGDAGLEAFRAELAAMPHSIGMDVTSRSTAAQQVRDVTAFQAAMLLAFALAAFVAATVLVGQAVARHATTLVGDLRILTAVGMTRRLGLCCAAAGPLVAALAGTALGEGLAVVASAWLPFGAAATVEPTPGLDVDPLVFGVGAVLTPLLVVGVSVAATALALRGAPGRGRRSPVAAFAARLGLPVPVTMGVRFALEPGRGADAVPVRPALLGAVTGVLGVTAAAVFGAGVADATGTPQRFGQTFEIAVGYGYNGDTLVDVPLVAAAMTADPDVTSLRDTRYAFAASGPATVLAFTDDGPTPQAVVTGGRAPTAPGEVLLAPTSARLLGARIGSTVPFAGDHGSTTLTVVGLGLLPQTAYNGYDAGAWVVPADYDRMFAGFLNRAGYLRLRPGADPLAAIGRIEAATATMGGGAFLFPDVAPTPTRLAQIRDIRVIPLVLGVFLAVLAVGAVGHTLAASVRRRRRDVAVLRALGMTRRQVRTVLLTQGAVTAAIGLAFGIALGLAAGRVLWRVVADLTPLQYQPPPAGLAVLLVVPAALAVTIALTVLPARRATRLRVTQVLGAE